ASNPHVGWRETLVSAVLIVISIDRVLSKSWVITVVIYFRQLHMPVDKANNTFSIAIEGHVAFAGFAFVPGEWRMGGPFHDQQSRSGMFDRGQLTTGDIGNRLHGHTVENITAIIESWALAEWLWI